MLFKYYGAIGCNIPIYIDSVTKKEIHIQDQDTDVLMHSL